MTRKINIAFITPCFCRGADCSENGRSEIRPASIRGQLHWWFRALGGAPRDENEIFGTVHGGAKASTIVVRVGCPEQVPVVQSPTLPHKTGGPGAPRNAIAPGVSFDLLLSTRLGGLNADLQAKFDRALQAWLLMGSLGLRATRGGGNFTWDGQPATLEAFETALRDVTSGSQLRTAFLGRTFDSAEAARKVMTDTLADQAFGNAATLGRAFRGRKTSPLRFRIVKFNANDFRILAIWDGRQVVTGNTEHDLRQAIDTLNQSGKEIGRLLAASSLSR
ncbi:MAG: type III-B CRISPR module RAMP protein Cmr1 [Kiritimatiellia bacterium]|jgi:hypothetical protein